MNQLLNRIRSLRTYVCNLHTHASIILVRPLHAAARDHCKQHFPKDAGACTAAINQGAWGLSATHAQETRAKHITRRPQQPMRNSTTEPQRHVRSPGETHAHIASRAHDTCATTISDKPARGVCFKRNPHPNRTLEPKGLPLQPWL